jgi:Rrf2 family protein
MRVSMKVDYGVRALVDLAQNYGAGPVQTSEIAARQGVPEPYLDQLLSTLRKVGLVKSRRGPHGGYVLAKDPSELSVGAIMAALEGPTIPIDCLDGSLNCSLAGHCTQQDIWRKVEGATQAVLQSTKLTDLLHTQKQPEQRAMYYI